MAGTGRIVSPGGGVRCGAVGITLSGRGGQRGAVHGGALGCAGSRGPELGLCVRAGARSGQLVRAMRRLVGSQSRQSCVIFLVFLVLVWGEVEVVVVGIEVGLSLGNSPAA